MANDIVVLDVLRAMDPRTLPPATRAATHVDAAFATAWLDRQNAKHLDWLRSMAVAMGHVDAAGAASMDVAALTAIVNGGPS